MKLIQNIYSRQNLYQTVQKQWDAIGISSQQFQRDQPCSTSVWGQTWPQSKWACVNQARKYFWPDAAFSTDSDAYGSQWESKTHTHDNYIIIFQGEFDFCTKWFDLSHIRPSSR